MKAISKVIFTNFLPKNFTTFSKFYISNKLFNFSIPKLLTINKTQKNYFSECDKSGCGCHGSAPEDELEKTLKSLNQRVMQCINLGNFSDALELSDEYISNEHPFYCSAVNNKAFILKTCGEYDEAKVLFEEVIEKYKKIYGENNDKVVITKQNLATLYRDSKQTDLAIEMFEKLIDDIQNFKVDVKPNVMANIYNSVSGCYRVNKNFNDAQENLNKAYKIIKENYGEKNLPIATIFNNIGMNHKDQGNFKEALENYQKALSIRSEVLPEDHPDVMSIVHNIGQLYFDYGDKENASLYFNKNIKNMEKKKNHTSPDGKEQI